jgi:hypothetical protein
VAGFFEYRGAANRCAIAPALTLGVTSLCLKCHGKKSDAPPTVRNSYSAAFDYKVGDLRGIMSIKMPKKESFTGGVVNLGVAIRLVIFLLAFIVIGLAIQRYKNKTEERTP